MANSFLRLKAGILNSQLLKLPLGVSNTGCRNLMCVAINGEAELQDVLPVHETLFPTKASTLLDPYILKEKEKGDWRFLTMEEKRQLYQMSVNDIYPEAVPGDEWKTILAGTFVAMGLMTMGIYVWFTQFVYNGFPNQLSAEKPSDAQQPKILMEILLHDKIKSVLESQARH